MNPLIFDFLNFFITIDCQTHVPTQNKLLIIFELKINSKSTQRNVSEKESDDISNRGQAYSKHPTFYEVTKAEELLLAHQVKVSC